MELPRMPISTNWNSREIRRKLKFRYSVPDICQTKIEIYFDEIDRFSVLAKKS
jgi:hypothetical protein